MAGICPVWTGWTRPSERGSDVGQSLVWRLTNTIDVSRRIVRALALLVIVTRVAVGQRAAQPLTSLGQPPIWRPYLVGGASFAGMAKSASAVASFGIGRYVTNPVTGLLAARAEGYVGVSTSAHSGARVLAASPALGLSAGVDFSVDESSLATVLSYKSS